MKKPHHNCHGFERLAWLEASDELGRFRRLRLDRHCRRCAACAEYRRSIPAWEAAAQEALAIGDTGSAHVDRVIRSLPEECAAHRKRRLVGAPHILRPALAGLGLLLAAVGLWQFRPAQDAAFVDGALPATAGWTEMDTWKLEVDLLDHRLHALQRDLLNGLDPGRENGPDDLDDLVREMMLLEEILG